jgi:cyclopropane-fatty-acyl-phospholipid synthase
MKPTTARLLAHRLFTQVRGGTLRVSDPHGTRAFGRPGGAATPIEAAITVHDDRFYARLLAEGSIGLGESYADGWWDADHLTGALRLAHRSLRRAHPLLDRVHRVLTPAVDPLARRRRSDQRRDQVNVRAHYDLGNDLFQRFLDPSMMYSCAVFDAPGQTLEDASRAKLDRLAALLELGPDDHVLEIGTGWGGFAIHAARTRGCKVTTTTLSPAQREIALERVAAAGLSDRVTVLLEDYRELRGRFDKLVSIEMIEAVGHQYFDTFFRTCAARLESHGLMALQAILISDGLFESARRTVDFIKAYIFPGGCLPSLAEIGKSLARACDLRLTHFEDITPHYARTLRSWTERFEQNRAAIARLGYSSEFQRMWEFYLCYCEAGFIERRTASAQLVLAMPEARGAPILGTLPA